MRDHVHPAANGTIHIVLVDGAVHFMDGGKAKSVGVMEPDFAAILDIANRIFQVLATHSIHRQSYPNDIFAVATVPLIAPLRSCELPQTVTAVYPGRNIESIIRFRHSQWLSDNW